MPRPSYDDALVAAGARARTRRLLETVTMPPEVARLPRNVAGYPIPWFVATLPDGTRDFRIACEERQLDAIRLKLCPEQLPVGYLRVALTEQEFAVCPPGIVVADAGDAGPRRPRTRLRR